MCIGKRIILKKLSIESLKESGKERAEIRELIGKNKEIEQQSERKTEDSCFYSTGVFTGYSNGNLVS